MLIWLTALPSLNPPQHADNPELQREWAAAKMENKVKLAAWIKEKSGYTVSPNVLFDIQVGGWGWARCSCWRVRLGAFLGRCLQQVHEGWSIVFSEQAEALLFRLSLVPQVKRIHEYKRQLLNLISIVHRYDCIKAGGRGDGGREGGSGGQGRVITGGGLLLGHHRWNVAGGAGQRHPKFCAHL